MRIGCGEQGEGQVVNTLTSITNPKTLFALLVNSCVSILVPLAIELVSGGLSTLQSVGVGLAVFVWLTSIEALALIREVFELRVGEVRIWEDRLATDNVLSDIRTGLHDMAGHAVLRDAFFLDYYRRELALVRQQVKNTLANLEIPIERHHIESTEKLLSVFDNAAHSSFWATAVCGDIGDSFDVTYQFYFNAWVRRLRDGTVDDLRRIFVFSDTAELLRPNTLKLLAFHRHAA